VAAFGALNDHQGHPAAPVPAAPQSRVAVDRVPVPPVVVEALVAQGIDAGLTEEQAEAESRNPQKRAAALAAVQANWARGYLARRNRSS